MLQYCVNLGSLNIWRFANRWNNISVAVKLGICALEAVLELSPRRFLCSTRAYETHNKKNGNEQTQFHDESRAKIDGETCPLMLVQTVESFDKIGQGYDIVPVALSQGGV